MTTSNEVDYATYPGTGSTGPFPFLYKIYSSDQLIVFKVNNSTRVRTDLALTSGAGNPGDIPAVMRSQAMKLLLMFYTPGSALYSRAKALGLEWAKGDKSKAITSAFWLIPFSAAIHYLSSGRTPNEDKEETLGGQVLKETLTYPFSAFPMGAEVAKAFVNVAEGKPESIEVSSPVFKAMEHSFHAAAKTAKWYEDEAEFEDVARELFKVSGYWMGAPTEQMEITGGYMADLLRGKADPNDIFEFTHDVLWRRPPSRR